MTVSNIARVYVKLPRDAFREWVNPSEFINFKMWSYSHLPDAPDEKNS